MGDAAGRRSLSDLPDDLLRRILFFTPAMEAASTSVLSRRWRSLWRSSGAVNLQTRSFNQERAAFLGAAEKALAAAEAGTIRRLTFFVEKYSGINLSYNDNWNEHNLVAAVVSNPAAQRVEELHIESVNREWKLSFGSLPSKALRVLCMVRCSPLTGAPGGAFPLLAVLHLEDCSFSLGDLQITIHTAPLLSRLHLESCHYIRQETTTDDRRIDFRLRCPAVTDLVLADCKPQWNDWEQNDRIELDVPRLQHFRYEGTAQSTNFLSLKPQAPPNLIQVDLHLTDDDYCLDDLPIRELFRKFIQNFKTTKILKITLDFSMHRIALADKESQEELLGSSLFGLLERLELDAQYDPGSKTSMAMLANLLHCCPVVRNLWVKLSKHITRRSYAVDEEAQVEFDKSVDRFLRSKRPMVSLGGEDGDDTYDQADFNVPGFSDHKFTCLQSYLRRVSLVFCMNEPNCLGVQLAKFFAEKAMVLEEMYIDDGSQKFCEHTNLRVRRWIGNSAIRRSSDVKSYPQ